MTTQVYLIRHAATAYSAEDRFTGASSSSVPLCDEGRWQAALLARRLVSRPPAAIYCSPAARAMETAALLGQPHGLAPQPRDGLSEIDYGHWEGLSRREVMARFPDELTAWEADPFGYAPSGGETGMAVMSRAIPCLRDIISAHLDQTVFVVSHKATNRIIISYHLGIELADFRKRIDQQPACLNILDFRDLSRARLRLLNDVSHYEGEPNMAHGHLSPWWASERETRSRPAELGGPAVNG